MVKPRASHFPREPRGFIILRILQLIFAIIVLALAAYSVWWWEGIEGSGPPLAIFTSLATLISIVYIFVATYGVQSIYNYWAILGLEIFLIIFWLISFAVTAARTGFLASYYRRYSVGVGLGGIGATAGLSAIMFLLYIFSLTIYTIHLLHFRKDGGHSSPSKMGGVAPQAYEPNTVMPESKIIEMQPQANTYQQHPQQPQQQYAQPQYAQQTPVDAQYMAPQPTGMTAQSGVSAPADHATYQQPTHYAPPAQYESGPQQLDSQQAPYRQ